MSNHWVDETPAPTQPVAEANPKDIAGSKKVPLHLFPAAGIIYGAMACKEGARKYGPYNWRDKKIKLSEYLSAIDRHSLAVRDGEWIDKESGQPHLGKIVATAAIVLDAAAHNALIVDIPPPGQDPGPAPALLEFFREKA